MKKKQVVALLLAAAMTTASFLPSTGFFNVMEVQAETSGVGTAWNNSKTKTETVTIDSTTAQAITTTDAIDVTVGSETDDATITIMSGGSVSLRSVISGSAFTSQSAISSMSGLYIEAVGLKAYTGVQKPVTESTGALETETTSGAAFSGSLENINGFGAGKIYFDGATTQPFGKFNLKVKLDPNTDVEVGSVKVTTDSATDVIATGTEITSGSPLNVTLGALKAGEETLSQTEIDEYVSGGSFHYQWEYNSSTSSSITTGWTTCPAIDKQVEKAETGQYRVAAWYGDAKRPASPKIIGSWIVKDSTPDATIYATCVTPGTLSYAGSDYKFTVDNAALWNEAKGKKATETNSLVYSWYTVEKDVVDSLPKNGVSSASADVIVNSKAAFITSGSANTLYIKDYESYFKNKEAYVAVVISAKNNAESIKKAFHIHQDKVGYTESTGNNNGRSNSSRSSGSSGTSTGTNSSTGSNTANNNTSNTGTTNNASTTTTPTTTPTSNTVTNADGSKTTTTSETKADGTKVETTKTEYPDGSTLEVTKETKPDGTTIETTVETAANGDKATTVYTVSPNGTKSKKVSIVKADGTSETSTITENKDGSATIVNETKDASGTTSMAYSLPAGAAGVTLDKIETTAKKVVIPAKIAIAGGAATLKGVTSLKANTLTLEGKTIKVTKVGAAALKGNKTATNLVVGKNIKTIGKQAFMNASKVKTVNIKGNVNTVGKNSFKNINKKATIKIKTTAKQFKALKKKIKNKGAAPAKVTYKRVK